MKALLIPIKDPANAKTRLAELLSEEERRRLLGINDGANDGKNIESCPFALLYSVTKRFGGNRQEGKLNTRRAILKPVW